MNRQERRREAARNRHNKFVDGYVKHLPEIPADSVDALLGTPGAVVHAVYYHDDWCSIYVKENGGLADCNCKPIIKYHQEPKRS
jgi:hypothetical protein